MNAYMRQIQENGGIITNRFPDMIARGFSYVTILLNLKGTYWSTVQSLYSGIWRSSTPARSMYWKIFNWRLTQCSVLASFLWNSCIDWLLQGLLCIFSDIRTQFMAANLVRLLCLCSYPMIWSYLTILLFLFVYCIMLEIPSIGIKKVCWHEEYCRRYTYSCFNESWDFAQSLAKFMLKKRENLI